MEEGNAHDLPKPHPSILKVIEKKKEIRSKLSRIKHRIGVYSAKGGVGKTTTAVNIAYSLKSLGYRVGILDADIDCPNVTMFLGIDNKLEGDYPLRPVEKDGIRVISSAMFMDDLSKPVIWRGPMIGKMVSELIENTDWGELDYLVLDLPPGTSDSPLSVIQLMDLDGFVLVTSPQHIAAVNAIRSGTMAKRLGVALIGVVENMSDGVGNGGEEVSRALGCRLLGRILFDIKFNYLSDKGLVPFVENEAIREEYLKIAREIVGGN